MFTFSINWLAVALSALASQLLGAAWFMGVIPKLYAKALGRDPNSKEKPGALFIAGPALCGLVVIITNAVLLGALRITAMPPALAFGAITGVGYLCITVQNVGINPNVPRPFLYGAINAPYFLLSNLASCAILTALA